MGKLAFVFPGQGSQNVGMGRELYENHPAAHRVFDQADAVLGFELSRICFEGPESELTLTTNAQPAILAASIAAWRLIQAEGIRPDVLAGHSLGEYSAVVAAGGLSFEDAVFAVRRRGELTQKAVPVGVGMMAAILGLSREAVAEVCVKAAEGEIVELANINCPGQIVIAGHGGAVSRAVDEALLRGAKKAVRLDVSAPFHSSLMLPAQRGMREVLDKIEFSNLEIPLINNADVAVLTDAQGVRQGLVKQVVAPVRWQETVERMLAMGVETVVEIGPGRVLSGLVRRVDRSLVTYNIDDEKTLVQAVESLSGRRKDG